MSAVIPRKNDVLREKSFLCCRTANFLLSLFQPGGDSGFNSIVPGAGAVGVGVTPKMAHTGRMVETMSDSAATTNLDSTFATLSEVGAQLNEGTDSLNQILRGVEKKLDQLNLHVEAEVKLPLATKGEKDQYFGYGQPLLNEAASWGLYFRVEDERYAKKSVFDCSREIRVQTVKNLPKLLKSVEARARKIVSDIEEAKTAYLG